VLLTKETSNEWPIHQFDLVIEVYYKLVDYFFMMKEVCDYTGFANTYKSN